MTELTEFIDLINSSSTTTQDKTITVDIDEEKAASLGLRPLRYSAAHPNARGFLQVEYNIFQLVSFIDENGNAVYGLAPISKMHDDHRLILSMNDRISGVSSTDFDKIRSMVLVLEQVVMPVFFSEV